MALCLERKSTSIDGLFADIKSQDSNVCNNIVIVAGICSVGIIASFVYPSSPCIQIPAPYI